MFLCETLCNCPRIIFIHLDRFLAYITMFTGGYFLFWVVIKLKYVCRKWRYKLSKSSECNKFKLLRFKPPSSSTRLRMVGQPLDIEVSCDISEFTCRISGRGQKAAAFRGGMGPSLGMIDHLNNTLNLWRCRDLATGGRQQLCLTSPGREGSSCSS